MAKKAAKKPAAKKAEAPKQFAWVFDEGDDDQIPVITDTPNLLDAVREYGKVAARDKSGALCAFQDAPLTIHCLGQVGLDRNKPAEPKPEWVHHSGTIKL